MCGGRGAENGVIPHACRFRVYSHPIQCIHSFTRAPNRLLAAFPTPPICLLMGWLVCTSVPELPIFRHSFRPSASALGSFTFARINLPLHRRHLLLGGPHLPNHLRPHCVHICTQRILCHLQICGELRTLRLACPHPTTPCPRPTPSLVRPIHAQVYMRIRENERRDGHVSAARARFAAAHSSNAAVPFTSLSGSHVSIGSMPCRPLIRYFSHDGWYLPRGRGGGGEGGSAWLRGWRQREAPWVGEMKEGRHAPPRSTPRGGGGMRAAQQTPSSLATR